MSKAQIIYISSFFWPFLMLLLKTNRQIHWTHQHHLQRPQCLDCICLSFCHQVDCVSRIYCGVIQDKWRVSWGYLTKLIFSVLDITKMLQFLDDQSNQNSTFSFTLLFFLVSPITTIPKVMLGWISDKVLRY